MRRALVVGITGPVPDDGAEAAPGDPNRPPLTYAPTYAEELRAVLAPFEYPVTEPHQVPEPHRTPELLEQAMDGVLDGPGTVVVHLLAHAERHPQTGKLHLVADDGRLTGAHVETWLEATYKLPEGQQPLVLFVLDVCHAGVALMPHWTQVLPASRRRAWVIAACGDDDRNLAYDGRLTRALGEVLRDFTEDVLRVDERLPYIPFDRLCGALHNAVADLAKDGPPQWIRSTALQAHEMDIAAQLDFFPNPRYVHREATEASRALTDPALRPVVDQVLDIDHFLLRLTDRTDLREAARTGGCQGRALELEALSGWLSGTGAASQLVTGKPGAGKSVLLSVLVCAAHERLREPTRPLWAHLPVTPGTVPDLAVLHARHHGVEDLAVSLARQWQLAVPGDRPVNGLADVVRARFPGQSPTLIVDALDEAVRPADVDAVLLRPLLSAHHPDGRPVCRVLVGAREHPDLTALFVKARDRWSVLDLDKVPAARLRADLHHYVRERLLAHPGYGSRDQERVVAILADGISAELTSPGAAPPWGEYLVAGLYLRGLLRRPVITSTTRARREAEAVPHDLLTLAELDVAGRPDSWTRPVLSALAYAAGTGMPEQVLQTAAGAFSDDEPTLQDIRRALEEAKHYLRQDLGADGSTLHRLFHQGLAERLQAEPLLRTSTRGRP